MKPTLALIMLLLSAGMDNAVVHADELLTRQRTLSTQNLASLNAGDDPRNSGVIEVRGSLLSAPCLLATRSADLGQGHVVPRSLNLSLTGCGYGEPVRGYSAPTQAPLWVTITVRLSGDETPPLFAQQRVIRGGSQQLRWTPTTEQRRQLAGVSLLPALAYLRMDYE